MKHGRFILILSLLLVTAVLTLTAGNVPPQPTWWTGEQTALAKYYVQPGYPPFEPHARYLGDLKGTWKEMGIQYGQRAGDLIRLVFDGYYDAIFATIKDQNKILTDARKFGDYLAKLTPEAVQFMQGIGEGASAELKKTVYAGIGHDYDKILIINHYFGCRYTAAGKKQVPFEMPACSGMVVIGSMDGPTVDRTSIHAGTRDQVFFPQLYEVAYTTTPSDPKANRIVTICSAGEIGGQMVANNKGVSVSGYAGGNDTNLFSYGLEWNIGDWYGACFGNTAEETAQILTTGRPGFIEKTGQKIVMAAWGINWLIADPKDARVVEIIPGRYAVRKPGDFGEQGFIVCTNHCVATWSYDQNNQRTDVPMTANGAGAGTFWGLNASGSRYWTNYWKIKDFYGTIDRNTVMSWYGDHYCIDKDGLRHDYAWDANNKMWRPVHLFALCPCRHQNGYPDTYKGTTTDAKVFVAQDLAFYFTKGRVCEWKGPWDVLSLKFNLE